MSFFLLDYIHILNRILIYIYTTSFQYLLQQERRSFKIMTSQYTIFNEEFMEKVVDEVDTRSSESEEEISQAQDKLNLADYSLENKISQNGCSEVWLAHQKIEKRKVVIKIIKTDKLSINESFHLQQSEKAIICLKSNYFIETIQIINVGILKCIIMQYALKGDLSKYIGCSISPSTLKSRQHYLWAKNIIYQICLALNQIHQNGYVLRDLKPQNILMIAQFKIKLGDFGLAIPVGKVDLSLCGTINYMPPERLNLAKLGLQIQFSLDIWSLGITAYEILFGQLPYYSNSPSEMLEQIYEHIPQFPTDFGSEDKKFILSMLNINPKKRPSIKQILTNSFFKDNSMKENIY